MKRTTLLLFTATTLCIADPLFTNLTNFNLYAAQTIKSGYTPAMSFVPAATATVSEIDLALGFVSGVNAVTVSLDADAGGLPGSTLMSWSLSGLPSFGDLYAPQTILVTDPLTLDAGVPYWIAVSDSADTWAVWNWNGAGTTGLDAFESAGAWCVGDNSFCGNTTLGAFAVIDSPPTVPEPSVWLWSYAVIGLSVVFRGLRRLSNANSFCCPTCFDSLKEDLPQ